MSDPFQIVGTTIAEKYRVDGLLGEGGYGVVYAGFHLLLQTPVAIKLLKPVAGMHAGEKAATEQFLREARVLFTLSHPSIVRMYDVGEVATRMGGVPYVVLERLDGIGLDEEIANRKREGRGGFGAREMASLFDGVLDALAFAHKHGVVHRDLKPSNIMLVNGPSGAPSGVRVAKVLDFGTARASSMEASSGMTGFTPRYASPEQWDPSFGTTGPATDLFSMGLILAESATLTPAFSGSTTTQVLAAAVSPTHLVRVRPLRPDLPEAFEQLVLRATARPMHERFVSADEMRASLATSLATSLEGSSSTGPYGAPNLPPSPYAPLPPSPYAPLPPSPYAPAPPTWTGASPSSSSSGAWIAGVVGALMLVLLLGGVVGFFSVRSKAATSAPVAVTKTGDVPDLVPSAIPSDDPTSSARSAAHGAPRGASSTATHGGAPPAAPAGGSGKVTLSLSRAHVAPGEHFSVHFSPALSPTGERYWITVLAADAPDTEWGDWSYLQVGQSDQALTAPTKPGSYEVRLHDSYPKYTTHVSSRIRFAVDTDGARDH